MSIAKLGGIAELKPVLVFRAAPDFILRPKQVSVAKAVGRERRVQAVLLPVRYALLDILIP